MMHLYPYSNMHELNLDWIIAEVKAGRKDIEDFRAYLNQGFEAIIREYIRENLADVVGTAIYNAESEQIEFIMSGGVLNG